MAKTRPISKKVTAKRTIGSIPVAVILLAPAPETEAVADDLALDDIGEDMVAEGKVLIGIVVADDATLDGEYV